MFDNMIINLIKRYLKGIHGDNRVDWMFDARFQRWFCGLGRWLPNEAH